MAILAECPTCHRKRAVSHKTCKCGQNMDSAKRSRRVRYWVSYYLPSGKQRRELCDRKNPYSIDLARAADGKRKTQKVENPSILERLPEEKMTFKELAEWYLKGPFKERVYSDGLKDSVRPAKCLDNFNAVCGDRIVRTITVEDLQVYRSHRKRQGRADSTIDQEMVYVRAVIASAFENRKVSGQTLRTFKSKQLKQLLRDNSNARDNTLSFDAYIALRDSAADHLSPMIEVGMYTGMRTGEIHSLRWSYVDLKNGFLRLPKDITKENKPKNIPIAPRVKEILESVPKALHHDFVFTYRGDPITTAGGHKKAFITACKDANIPYGTKTPGGITFRDIRTTVKTNMVNAGVSKVYRDTILGHSLKGMDKYYIKPSEDDLRAAMTTYAAWLDDQIKKAETERKKKAKAG